MKGGCSHKTNSTNPLFLPLPIPFSKVRDDYRMDVDEDRGGIGGGALRMMQRQGFDLRDYIGTPQERGEEVVREVSMTQ